MTNASTWISPALLPLIGLCAIAPAQHQLHERAARWSPIPPRGPSTSATTLGDVDGDGDLDLVFGHGGAWNEQQNRLLLNDGTGQFTDVTAVQMPQLLDMTTALVLGDLDGDGDLDLVIANSSDFGEANKLYHNDGSGTFTDVSGTHLPMNFDPTYALALGDVDGDGDLDIVCGNGDEYPSYGVSAQNRLYLNNGNGSFIDATVGRMPTDTDDTGAVELCDVDGDGDLDLLLGNSPGYPVSNPQDRLYLNDSAGNFTDVTATHMPADTLHATAFTVGDVEGDGDLDLVIGIAGSTNRLYRNDGLGTFTDVTVAQLPAATASCVELSDVDLDGDLDLVIGDGFNGPAQNRLQLNDGAGIFTDVTATNMAAVVDFTTAIALGDVDGDGDPDLVTANHSGPDRLFWNRGGVFVDAAVSDVRLTAHDDTTAAIQLIDVDGDGDRDMVVCNADGSQIYSSWRNRLHLNDGNGTFTEVTASHVPPNDEQTISMAAADVDGDGFVDLAFGTVGQCFGCSLRTHLWLNDGTGMFSDETVARLPLDWGDTRALAFGDVDGDGDPDLVIGNNGGLFGTQNGLYINDGTGTFTDGTAGRLPAIINLTTALALGDVDGDGDLDLVTGNNSSPFFPSVRTQLYRNDGTGVFTDVTAAQLPVDPDDTQALALGDVDGDGDLDLLVGNSAAMGSSVARQNRLYINDGAGGFADATAARLPAMLDVTETLALADLDADSDLDVIVGNDQAANAILVNDGTGTFTHAPARLDPQVADTRALATGDADGDGDLDVVVGNDGYNRLLTNRHNQLVAIPAFIGRRFELELWAKPGYATAAHLASAVISFGLAPVPLDVPGFGTFHLNTAVMSGMPLVVIPPGTAPGLLGFDVPNQSAFVGLVLYSQGVVLNTADPSDARLTVYERSEIR